MSAVLAVFAGIILLAIAKDLPTWLVLGIVALIAFQYRRQARAVSHIIQSWGERIDNGNAWAAPSARDRHIAQKGLTLALNRTELCSVFPGRGF